jgi:hypothetical protein
MMGYAVPERPCATRSRRTRSTSSISVRAADLQLVGLHGWPRATGRLFALTRSWSRGVCRNRRTCCSSERNKASRGRHPGRLAIGRGGCACPSGRTERRSEGARWPGLRGGPRYRLYIRGATAQASLVQSLPIVDWILARQGRGEYPRAMPDELAGGQPARFELLRPRPVWPSFVAIYHKEHRHLGHRFLPSRQDLGVAEWDWTRGR